MTRLQKAQLRQSELRTKIAAELDKSGEERDSAELERLTREMQACEVEVRAAFLIEEEQTVPDVVETAEGRDMPELRSRVQFGRYIEAALGGSGVMDGAEAELNQELGLRADYFPLDLLAGQWQDPVETRAKRDGDAMASQGDWLNRVFASTAAMALGVSFRNVNPGVATYPVTTAGGWPFLDYARRD